MKNKNVPFTWHADQLELVAFHRYTSHTTDTVIEVDNDDVVEDNTDAAMSILWFQALKKRVLEAYMDMGADGIRTKQWDNKVVIECRTSQGNTIYVGYYDWFYTIGFGVRSDSHIKPYPFVPKPE